MTKAWKLLGLAGLAGVAATGAIVARDERRRREVAPNDVRERLRARHAEAVAAAFAPTDAATATHASDAYPAPTDATTATTTDATPSRCTRLRRRWRRR